MAPENLQVDTAALTRSAASFQAASDAIPDAPAAFVPAGSDPLSIAIAAVAPQILMPVVTGLPLLKAQTSQFAQNLATVAERYAATDAQLHSKLSAHQFGAMGGTGGGDGGGPLGGSPAAPALTGTQSAGTSSQAASQLGQLMQTPMQMAMQAAQIPTQALGSLSSIPQAAMQVGQQFSGLFSQHANPSDGASESNSDGDHERDAREDAQREDAQARTGNDDPQTMSAHSGPLSGERVPDTAQTHGSSRQSLEEAL